MEPSTKLIRVQDEGETPIAACTSKCVYIYIYVHICPYVCASVYILLHVITWANMLGQGGM